MINFLYCFDKNYVTQAQTSINSLLNMVSEKVVINIISDHEPLSSQISEKIKNHNMLGGLNIYSFKQEEYNFPELTNAHVSSATYFRILIDNFLPKDLGSVVYLDSDIICMNNPVEILKATINDLKKKNLAIAAHKEGTRTEAPIIFNKLKLKSNNYFNAGVLVINYDYWVEHSISQSLLDIMKNRQDDLIFWDQDVLNIYIDGEFMNISKNLNYNYVELENLDDKNVFFLHYAGKNKPWEVQNILNQFSKIYQDNYCDLQLEKYHITFKKDKRTLIRFFQILITLDFMKLEKPLTYLRLSLKALVNVN